jgi:hypothetical protein
MVLPTLVPPAAITDKVICCYLYLLRAGDWWKLVLAFEIDFT